MFLKNNFVFEVFNDFIDNAFISATFSITYLFIYL